MSTATAIENGLQQMIDSHSDMCMKAGEEDWAVPLKLELMNGKQIRFDLTRIQNGLLTGENEHGEFTQIPSSNVLSYSLTSGRGWEFGGKKEE